MATPRTAGLNPALRFKPALFNEIYLWLELDTNPKEQITKFETVKAHPDFNFNIVFSESLELTITLVPAARANGRP